MSHHTLPLIRMRCEANDYLATIATGAYQELFGLSTAARGRHGHCFCRRPRSFSTILVAVWQRFSTRRTLPHSGASDDPMQHCPDADRRRTVSGGPGWRPWFVALDKAGSTVAAKWRTWYWSLLAIRSTAGFNAPVAEVGLMQRREERRIASPLASCRSYGWRS